MLRYTLKFALIWCIWALGCTNLFAQDSLLGQMMVRASREALARTRTTAGSSLVEEMPLQAARGETPSGDKAVSELFNGNILVDAVAWVAGHAAASRLIGAAAMAAHPLAGELAANLAGEVSGNLAVAAYNKKKIDWVDFAGRSVFGAAGSALGVVLLPGLGPVVGSFVGGTVGDIIWEQIRPKKPKVSPPSKTYEWYAGEAPPLGAYQAPRLRGASIL